LPPRFQEDVWNRIARSEAAATVSPWREFAHWLERVLPRRAVVASYLTILVLAGVAAGYWNGREKAAQLRDELGARYVQSVDPFQVIDVRK
jgi:hypothetical protein